MKYWVAYEEKDDKEVIVAFHEDEEVVREYVNSVDEITYKVGRCKASELKKIADVEGLYLVKHLDTYVQQKFYEFLEGIAESELYELKSTAGTLERILRIGELDKSDKKALIKTVAYLKGLILEVKELVPGYEEAQRQYAEYELQQERQFWGERIDLEDTDRYLIDKDTTQE